MKVRSRTSIRAFRPERSPLHQLAVLGAFLLLTLLLIPPAGATVIHYFNDFEGAVGLDGWSNTSSSIATVTLTDGRTVLGPFGTKGELETVSLAVTGLSSSNLTLSFDLLIFDDWDGSAESYGPDIWELSFAGGSTLLNTTFANSSQSQAYPDGGSNPRRTGAAEVLDLNVGLWTGADDRADSVYQMSFSFPYTEESIVLNFSSTVTGSTELFGLDNVRLEGDGVGVPHSPEPATLLLLGSGLVGLGASGWVRRRKKNQS